MLKRYDPSRVRQMYVEAGIPFAECCRKVGWNRKQAERVRKILQPERQSYLQRTSVIGAQAEVDLPEPTIEESGDTRSMTGFTERRIKTLDELLAHFGVDTAVWEVERWKCGQWQMGYKDRNTQQPGAKNLYKIEATFKRRKLMVAIREEINALIEASKDWAPRFPAIMRPQWLREQNAAEVSIYDHHLGKLCWALESGDDYDLKIATQLYLDCAEKMVSQSKIWEPSRFIFVAGNDFLNADNASNLTTRGTPQSMDGRYLKVFQRGRELLTTVIEMMMTVAPVDVIMVPGNHDWQSTFALGDSLSMYFRNCADVSIDNRPNHRKYYRWGECLLGFVHGDKQKPDSLPLQMAQDEKEAWGKTSFREFHTGHWHAKRAWEWQGVIVDSLPSLCGTDAWHNESGFTHNLRSARAMIWSQSDGRVGDAFYTIKPDI